MLDSGPEDARKNGQYIGGSVCVGSNRGMYRESSLREVVGPYDNALTLI